MTTPHRFRALLTLATDNWLSRIYLAAVTAATVFFLYDTAFVDHPDASMAAAVPWLLTAPVSLLYTLLPDTAFDGAGQGLTTAAFVAGTAAAALINAVVMGAAARKLLPPARPTTPSA